MSRPRLIDISRQTGFSVATVQRALGAPHLLAESTRTRIIEKMEELGYVPDRNAAGLVTNSTGFVALVVSSVTSSTFADTIQGVADFTQSIGSEMLIAQTAYDQTREYDVIRAILGRRPDGIVLTFSPSERRTRVMLKQAGTPVVEIWDLPKRPIDMVAGISNEEAAVQVATYFVSKGYENPAFFGQLIGRDTLRWRAFSEEYKKLTGRTPTHIAVGTGKSVTEEDFDAGEAFLDRRQSMDVPFDSVFCGSDITAAGIVFAAARRGIKVPKQLAICGFGDLRFARSMTPGLTTVHVPSDEMGRMAGALIQARSTQKSTSSRIVFQTSLVPRDTA